MAKELKGAFTELGRCWRWHSQSWWGAGGRRKHYQKGTEERRLGSMDTLVTCVGSIYTCASTLAGSVCPRAAAQEILQHTSVPTNCPHCGLDHSPI